MTQEEKKYRVMTEAEMRIAFGENWQVDCACCDEESHQIKPWVDKGKLNVLGQQLRSDQAKNYLDGVTRIKVHCDGRSWTVHRNCIVEIGTTVLRKPGSSKKSRLVVTL